MDVVSRKPGFQHFFDFVLHGAFVAPDGVGFLLNEQGDVRVHRLDQLVEDVLARDAVGDRLAHGRILEQRVLEVHVEVLECEPGVDPSASACHERWSGRFQRANESAEQDAIFALESVITRHGRLASLELLRGGRHAATAADANLVEGLLDVVSRARLEQAPAPPLSDLGRMVWWVEHATVRATTKPPEDLPLPSKKRADTTSRGPHILTV